MVQFLGTWEASKKRGVFLILACIYKYIEDFEEQYLSKVLFSNAPNALNIASGSEANITTPCEMDIFNFLWLIWDHYLPLAPT